MKIWCWEVPKPTDPSLLWPAEWKAPAPLVFYPPPAGRVESLPNICETVTDTPHKKNPVVIVIRMQMTNMVKIMLIMISDKSLMMLMMISDMLTLIWVQVQASTGSLLLNPEVIINIEDVSRPCSLFDYHFFAAKKTSISILTTSFRLVWASLSDGSTSTFALKSQPLSRCSLIFLFTILSLAGGMTWQSTPRKDIRPMDCVW